MFSQGFPGKYLLYFLEGGNLLLYTNYYSSMFCKMTFKDKGFFQENGKMRQRTFSDWTQLVFFTPSSNSFLESYHQINVRSLAAKLAGAETVIKGMHSIKKNPITFCIREIKCISYVSQGQSLWEKLQERGCWGQCKKVAV